ncbi:hypothetical protein QE152_g27234 [Popillia japonica]|uniref:Uncharacterized protein n=1 Tax=Popillia japonica TaxID=7064 RepID=A0AAW1JW89_POPJA
MAIANNAHAGVVDNSQLSVLHHHNSSNSSENAERALPKPMKTTTYKQDQVPKIDSVEVGEHKLLQKICEPLFFWPKLQDRPKF